MASQQTPNYKLSRWAGTDRVLVEEFNDNWDKLDAALTARNCQIYTTTYVGDGDKDITRTLTFPHKPMVVFITGIYPDTFFSWFRGSSMALTLNSSIIYMPASTEGNSFSWKVNQTVYGVNVKDTVYTVLALLDPND